MTIRLSGAAAAALAGTLAGILAGPPAAIAGQPAPIADRDAAFRVVGAAARVERAFSTCRWVRGRPAPDLLARWRSDNRDVLDAALAVLRGQGGYTPERRAMAEDLAGLETGPLSESPAACEAFQADVRTGRLDLAAGLPPDVTRTVLGYRTPSGQPLLWVVEQRRRPDGVLARSARRADGAGVPACDAAEGAGRGHVVLRGLWGKPDPDPNLWYAECLESPVEPLTGAAPVRRDAGIPDAPDGAVP